MTSNDFGLEVSGRCAPQGSARSRPRHGLELERADAERWAEHYEVSMACGERSLLPATRNASADTLLVADGFPCRTQIEHGARRRPLHFAQVLALAERGEVPAQPRDGVPGKLLVGALLACGAVYAAKRAWPT